MTFRVKEVEMSEKRQVNDFMARLIKLVGPLVVVILTVVVCLLLSDSPLRAAPDRSLFE